MQPGPPERGPEQREQSIEDLVKLAARLRAILGTEGVATLLERQQKLKGEIRTQQTISPEVVHKRYTEAARAILEAFARGEARSAVLRKHAAALAAARAQLDRLRAHEEVNPILPDGSARILGNTTRLEILRPAVRNMDHRIALTLSDEANVNHLLETVELVGLVLSESNTPKHLHMGNVIEGLAKIQKELEKQVKSPPSNTNVKFIQQRLKEVRQLRSDIERLQKELWRILPALEAPLRQVTDLGTLRLFEHMSSEDRLARTLGQMSKLPVYNQPLNSELNRANPHLNELRRRVPRNLHGVPLSTLDAATRVRESMVGQTPLAKVLREIFENPAFQKQSLAQVGVDARYRGNKEFQAFLQGIPEGVRALLLPQVLAASAFMPISMERQLGAMHVPEEGREKFAAQLRGEMPGWIKQIRAGLAKAAGKRIPGPDAPLSAFEDYGAHLFGEIRELAGPHIDRTLLDGRRVRVLPADALLRDILRARAAISFQRMTSRNAKIVVAELPRYQDALQREAIESQRQILFNARLLSLYTTLRHIGPGTRPDAPTGPRLSPKEIAAYPPMPEKLRKNLEGAWKSYRERFVTYTNLLERICSHGINNEFDPFAWLSNEQGNGFLQERIVAINDAMAQIDEVMTHWTWALPNLVEKIVPLGLHDEEKKAKDRLRKFREELQKTRQHIETVDRVFRKFRKEQGPLMQAVRKDMELLRELRDVAPPEQLSLTVGIVPPTSEPGFQPNVKWMRAYIGRIRKQYAEEDPARRHDAEMRLIGAYMHVLNSFENERAPALNKAIEQFLKDLAASGGLALTQGALLEDLKKAPLRWLQGLGLSAAIGVGTIGLYAITQTIGSYGGIRHWGWGRKITSFRINPLRTANSPVSLLEGIGRGGRRAVGYGWLWGRGGQSNAATSSSGLGRPGGAPQGVPTRRPPSGSPFNPRTGAALLKYERALGAETPPAQRIKKLRDMDSQLETLRQNRAANVEEIRRLDDARRIEAEALRNQIRGRGRGTRLRYAARMLGMNSIPRNGPLANAIMEIHEAGRNMRGYQRIAAKWRVVVRIARSPNAPLTIEQARLLMNGICGEPPPPAAARAPHRNPAGFNEAVGIRERNPAHANQQLGERVQNLTKHYLGAGRTQRTLRSGGLEYRMTESGVTVRPVSGGNWTINIGADGRVTSTGTLPANVNKQFGNIGATIQRLERPLARATQVAPTRPTVGPTRVGPLGAEVAEAVPRFRLTAAEEGHLRRRNPQLYKQYRAFIEGSKKAGQPGQKARIYRLPSEPPTKLRGNRASKARMQGWMNWLRRARGR